MIRKLWLCFAVVGLLALPLFAQAPGAKPGPALHCQSIITTGSGLTLFQFCLTAEGNVLGLTSPENFTHIISGEGYSLCDAGTGKIYYDYAGEGDNDSFVSATITQTKGPNTLPVTIRRTTKDGLFNLTQVIDMIPEQKIVTIKMTVNNNDAATTRLVYLTRATDVDINNSSHESQSYFGFNNESVFAWGMNAAALDSYGLMLSTLTPGVPHQPLFNSYNMSMQTDACHIYGDMNQNSWMDGIFYLTHRFVVAKSAPQTVKVAYKRF